MATYLKIVVFSCLLSLIALMGAVQPVLAKKGDRLKQRSKILEGDMKDLKAKIKTLEDCKGRFTNSNRS